MLILVNPLIKNGITILPNKSSEIQWVRLSKIFFSFDRDIYLSFSYITPAYSSYYLRHNLDTLSLIEQDIASYSALGDVMIYGDTNARIGCETGFIDNDNKYIPTPHYTSSSRNSKARYSKDSVYNTRGK